MAYLVFDIETIPDTTVWSPPTDDAGPETPAAEGATEADAKPDIAPPAKKKRATRKRTGDPFAPRFAHRPVAIGAVYLDDNLHVQNAGVFGTQTYGLDERALLFAWNAWVASVSPTIVTYNGRGFDLPVLSLRAYRHGIQQAWYSKEYRYRYGDNHIDLFEAFTEHGLVPREGFSLDTFAQLIGLPGKGAMDGSKVAQLWEKKQIAKIEGYALCDTVKTAFVFLRYMLMRGRVSLDEYRVAAKALFQRSMDMALGGVTFGADTKQLLLEE